MTQLVKMSALRGFSNKLGSARPTQQPNNSFQRISPLVKAAIAASTQAPTPQQPQPAPKLFDRTAPITPKPDKSIPFRSLETRSNQAASPIAAPKKEEKTAIARQVSSVAVANLPKSAAPLSYAEVVAKNEEEKKKTQSESKTVADKPSVFTSLLTTKNIALISGIAALKIGFGYLAVKVGPLAATHLVAQHTVTFLQPGLYVVAFAVSTAVKAMVALLADFVIPIALPIILPILSTIVVTVIAVAFTAWVAYKIMQVMQDKIKALISKLPVGGDAINEYLFGSNTEPKKAESSWFSWFSYKDPKEQTVDLAKTNAAPVVVDAMTAGQAQNIAKQILTGKKPLPSAGLETLLRPNRANPFIFNRYFS